MARGPSPHGAVADSRAEVERALWLSAIVVIVCVSGACESRRRHLLLVFLSRVQSLFSSESFAFSRDSVKGATQQVGSMRPVFSCSVRNSLLEWQRCRSHDMSDNFRLDVETSHWHTGPDVVIRID